jgi:hypothetical protein
MKQRLEQQLKKIEQQEQRLLNKSSNHFIDSNITPFVNKIQEKIPDKLRSVLNATFYKGFQLVFEKGIPYIEKTYNKDKIAMDYDINNYAIDKECNRRHIIRMDKQSKQSGMVNSSFSALEGGLLGFLGIGLPDIPLFLSVMIKTINEIALSYGFDYNTEEEKVYILILINAAITKGDYQKNYDRELDQMAGKLDNGILVEVSLPSQMKITSDILSDTLLTAKFIQGIPLVGVVGGAVNYTILNKIVAYARIKYKKRYLLKKL